MSQPSGPPSVIAMLLEHWDDVLAALQPEDRAQLVQLLAAEDSIPVRTARVNRLLLLRLPPDAPVTRTVLGGGVGVRFQAATADPSTWARLTRLAAGSLDPRAAVASPGQQPEVDRTIGTPGTGQGAPSWVGLHAAVRERLAELPHRRPETIIGPADDVLRLAFAAGDVRVPAFQLDDDGRPLDVVLEVNRLLGARRDPWGVTSWWICRHAAFGRAPMDLLVDAGQGLPPDAGRALVAAAISVLED